MAVRHQQLVNPPPVHVDHFEAPVLIVEVFALGRQLLEHRQRKTGDGGEFAVGLVIDPDPVGGAVLVEVLAAGIDVERRLAGVFAALVAIIAMSAMLNGAVSYMAEMAMPWNKAAKQREVTV